MLNMSMHEPRSMAASKVPAGCWVDQHDWSIWPLDDYACSPCEWPYNLEAPQGSREFAGIVRWFVGKHPSLHEPDIGDCLKLVKECAPGKPLTAKVDCDPETGAYQLRFTIYECSKGGRLGSKELNRFWAKEVKLPALMALHSHVWVTDARRPFPGATRRAEKGCQ